jgi:hypothetical protein
VNNQSLRLALWVFVAGLSMACSSSNGANSADGGGTGSALPSSSGSTDASPSSDAPGSSANSGADAAALNNPETDGGGTLTEAGTGLQPDGGNSDAASANDAGGSDTEPPSSSTGTLPGAVIGGIDYNTYCAGSNNKIAMGGYGLSAPVSETNGVGLDTVEPLVAYPASLQVGGDLSSPTSLVEFALSSNNNTPLEPNTVYTTNGVGNNPMMTVLFKEGQPPCDDGSGQASVGNFVTVPDPNSPAGLGSTGLAAGNQNVVWTQHCKVNGQTVAGAGCANIVPGGTDAGP